MPCWNQEKLFYLPGRLHVLQKYLIITSYKPALGSRLPLVNSLTFGNTNFCHRVRVIAGSGWNSISDNGGSALGIGTSFPPQSIRLDSGGVVSTIKNCVFFESNLIVGMPSESGRFVITQWAGFGFAEVLVPALDKHIAVLGSGRYAGRDKLFLGRFGEYFSFCLLRDSFPD